MAKVTYKRRDELEAELKELKARCCENCTYLDKDFNCTYHLNPMMTFMYCSDWEKKDE